MRGVILAGGLGTRLDPLTRVTNKHLLPVDNRPMIYYPIENMVKSGIDEILIVTGGNHAGHFLGLLKNGKELGVRRLAYAYQEGAGGIADALKLARDFVEDQCCCVMLGDNLYQHKILPYVQLFSQLKDYAALLIAHTGCEHLVHQKTRFGIAVRGESTGLLNGYRPYLLIEKPREFRLNELEEQKLETHIVTGTYFYSPRMSVFDICDKLKPSARGELEITDVNNYYLEHNELMVLPHEGWWSDAGTFETLHTTADLVRKHGVNL